MTRTDTAPIGDLDGLRLTGLGRIPLCADCPRFQALSAAHARSRSGSEGSRTPLPAVPAACTFQFCAPLARRLGVDGDLEAQHAA